MEEELFASEEEIQRAEEQLGFSIPRDEHIAGYGAQAIRNLAYQIYSYNNLFESLSESIGRNEQNIYRINSELLQKIEAIKVPAGPSAPGGPAQDTGWRDITALTVPATGAQVTGNVLMRRVDRTVYLQFVYYSWKGAGNLSASNFLPPEICAYTKPPLLRLGGRPVQTRAAGAISCGDHRDFPFTYDWLSATSLRLSRNTDRTVHSLVSWLTETPFPESPLGEPLTVI